MDLRALTPGPSAWLLQIVALHLASVWERKDIGRFPFHQEGALVGGGHMAHELGIAKPTIGHDYRRRQVHAASAEGRHASIQYALYPVQLVPTRPSRPCGLGPANGKVDGHHQFALADDHDEEDAINTGEHPVLLATPPGTNQAQLLTILFEHRVIAHPGPLPATACGLACAGGVAP